MANNRKYGKWEVKKTIGRGSDGDVYLVTKNNGSDYFALKAPDDTHLRTGRFKKEAETLSLLDHPYVLKLIDYSLDADNPFMVTEYCNGGTLEAYRMMYSWPEAEKKAFYKKLISGITYIQSMGFVKGDQIANNIFLRKRGEYADPVLGDFGSCGEIKSHKCIKHDFSKIGQYYAKIWSVP